MTIRSILMAGVAALLPGVLAAAGPAGLTAPQGETRRFQPDQTRLVLTRTQWRSLGDGRQIVISRDYAVEILPCEGGYRIEGKLVDTSVDAPARLEALARLERARGDSGLFPIRLDTAGLIVSEAAPVRNPASSPAAGTGRAIVARSALPGPARQDALAAVDRIMAAAATASPWPTDLFNPVSSEREEHRAVALPDGEEGAVSIRITVEGLQPGSLPAAVERTITTRIAGSERSTRERWTMSPG